MKNPPYAPSIYRSLHFRNRKSISAVIEPRRHTRHIFRVTGHSFICGKALCVDRQGMLSPAGPTARYAMPTHQITTALSYPMPQPYSKLSPTPCSSPCPVVYNCSRNANTLLVLKPATPEPPSISVLVRVSEPRSSLVLHEDCATVVATNPFTDSEAQHRLIRSRTPLIT